MEKAVLLYNLSGNLKECVKLQQVFDFVSETFVVRQVRTNYIIYQFKCLFKLHLLILNKYLAGSI